MLRSPSQSILVLGGGGSSSPARRASRGGTTGAIGSTGWQLRVILLDDFRYRFAPEGFNLPQFMSSFYAMLYVDSRK